ncbi:pyruvate kinase [Lentzea fradiae]|uniref:Pyruvate kinase n=1 Tax=Lentzea fradiae TaxID=200378 RepID=A0A1G7XIY5_9PSEU|nr:pyruvate kinase [Lentzea fradiae]SDG83560.1 pyruvate kinase [Lentzea fradiae]
MTTMYATIGPATRAPETMTALVRLGVTGFRFSASKFGVAELAAQAADAEAAGRAAGRSVELLLDLPGAKIRFTNADSIDLGATPRFRVSYALKPTGEDDGLPDVGLSDPGLGDVISPGDVLLIGDGEIAARVISASGTHCVAEALEGGLLGPRKGVWVTGRSRRLPASSPDEDLALLDGLTSSAFTGAIVSFAENAAVLEPVRARWGGRSANSVMAKVETRAGVAAVAEVAGAADSVLVGRGDLLMDSGVLDFHALCSAAVRECRRLSVPVVVGTQLLSGMQSSWLPLRSELSYLCGLLESGVDGLLLTTETTFGRDPLGAAGLMADLIARYAEPGLVRA